MTARSNHPANQSARTLRTVLQRWQTCDDRLAPYEVDEVRALCVRLEALADADDLQADAAHFLGSPQSGPNGLAGYLQLCRDRGVLLSIGDVDQDWISELGGSEFRSDN